MKERRSQMVGKEEIIQVVQGSGLWDSGRETTHGFILSPDVYEVSSDRLAELQALGRALVNSLSGLGRIASIAADPRLGRGKEWEMIDRALKTGVPKVYHSIRTINPSRVPAVCKVDLMEAEDGKYWIAEVDGHNKHGLGYSTLAARIRRVICPEAQSFPGVAYCLAEEVKRRSGGDDKLVLLYADRERFYLPEFQILAAELSKFEIKLVVAKESDVKVRNGLVAIGGRICNLFVDFPFLYYNNDLNEALASLYERGQIDFLIPPKPFLGSKVVLALLRNEEKNPTLEAILRSQVEGESLEIVRSYTPKTYLVDKRRGEKHCREICRRGKFVLKESISSGMKGTVFKSDGFFKEALQQASNSYYNFVLQQEIANAPRRFSYFSEDSGPKQDNWFLRITVHYALHPKAGYTVGDIIVTARRDKKVHGALDCLQLGAIIV